MLKLENYYEVLELLFNLMPYVFWKDRQGRYLGSNLNQAINLGFSSPEEFIGKTIFDIIKNQESAKQIDDIDRQIMEENKLVIIEERIATSIGERIYLSQKSPIHNDQGEVIGLLGFAIDITDIKLQEEQLKQERDKLVKVAAQVAHDIRSPAASVLMLAKACTDLPEKERISLREAAMNIQDIANNLLSQYRRKDSDSSIPIDEKEPILLSALILQVLAEKRLQFHKLPVKIDYEFSQKGYFAFIKIESSALRRTLSNLINNSIDALEGKSGEITVKLDANSECVTLAVKDNGKGMSAELIQKIMNNEVVTKDKKEGHGIGLSQVRETLRNNHGKLSIESKLKKGAQINLTFPRTSSPNWVAEEIRLLSNDIIIILDDDLSIHGAWDARFEKIIANNLQLQLKHFSQGNEVLRFINTLSLQEKNRVFLLSDYELLKQELNGLEIIAQSQVIRSILVTSHYADKLVREQAVKIGTTILPKQLAAEAPIIVEENLPFATNANNKRTPDLIIVDDDSNFLDNLVLFAFSDLQVVKYNNPRQFLNEVDQFDQLTKICLDNNYKISEFNGLQIAKKLHDLGYKNLYLLSGETFSLSQIPNYLIVLRKDAIDNIRNRLGFN